MNPVNTTKQTAVTEESTTLTIDQHSFNNIILSEQKLNQFETQNFLK